MVSHELRAPDGSEVRLSLRAQPSSVALAREMVRSALTGWGYPANVVEDSMLVMSEIATNAVNAAPGSEIRLRCAVLHPALLLECWDSSSDQPTPRSHPSLAESGRGMTIVAGSAKEHGTHPCPGGNGKVVWALMSH